MSFWLLVACAIAMTIVQEIVPGRPVYHYGWYNALDIALFVLAAWQLRSLRKTHAHVFSALAAAARISWARSRQWSACSLISLAVMEYSMKCDRTGNSHPYGMVPTGRQKGVIASKA